MNTGEQIKLAFRTNDFGLMRHLIADGHTPESLFVAGITRTTSAAFLDYYLSGMGRDEHIDALGLSLVYTIGAYTSPKKQHSVDNIDCFEYAFNQIKEKQPGYTEALNMDAKSDLLLLAVRCKATRIKKFIFDHISLAFSKDTRRKILNSAIYNQDSDTFNLIHDPNEFYFDLDFALRQYRPNTDILRIAANRTDISECAANWFLSRNPVTYLNRAARDVRWLKTLQIVTDSINKQELYGYDWWRDKNRTKRERVEAFQKSLEKIRLRNVSALFDVPERQR